MKVFVDIEVYRDDIHDLFWSVVEIFQKYGLDPVELEAWENFYDDLMKCLERACELEVCG